MPSAWVGTVTTGELLSLANIGIEPVGQIYSANVQAVSSSYFPITTSEAHGEVTAFQAMLAKCMDSMNARADILGADGVVDCKLSHRLDNAQSMSGYLIYRMEITGTAVRDPNRMGNRYFAGVSCSELVALRRAGFEPCGFAVGNSVFYQVAWRQAPKRGPFGTWANEEVIELSQGPYTAREIAMGRMVDMARKCGGHGIVGVTIESRVIPSGTLMGSNMAALCRMILVGTAIRRNPSLGEEVTIGVTVPVN